MVASRPDSSPKDRHHQDPARELEIIRLGRRNESHGREDDGELIGLVRAREAADIQFDNKQKVRLSEIVRKA